MKYLDKNGLTHLVQSLSTKVEGALEEKADITDIPEISSITGTEINSLT